jgi:hypothetical protein
MKRTTELLCESNNMLVNAFSLGSVLFNTCLCIDLVMTLRNPFSPPSRRNKFFILGTVAVSIFVTFLSRTALKGPCREENRDKDTFQYRAM